MERQTVVVTGNTFPVRRQLRALGAQWIVRQRAWVIAADKADKARELVRELPSTEFRLLKWD